MSQPITVEEFSEILTSGFADVVSAGGSIAVGVSGGPDSMALVKLLSEWAEQNGGPEIYALIVDHGLRPESAEEAAHTHSVLTSLHHVKSNILKWDGVKSGAAIQEEARSARYALMAEYCAVHAAQHLFLAHHMDDQAETFLFRLAKGSGLDGLSGMQMQQGRGDMILCRPLLNTPKARLIATCDHYGLEYIQDPSNESDNFARVRLRKSMDVLAEEGLTVKRLSMTSMRMRRARHALESIADKAFAQILLEKDTGRVVLSSSALLEWPDDIALRVVLKVIDMLRPAAEYAPRMEKIEALFADLINEAPFRKRTLGGLVFSRGGKNNEIIIEHER